MMRQHDVLDAFGGDEQTKGVCFVPCVERQNTGVEVLGELDRAGELHLLLIVKHPAQVRNQQVAVQPLREPPAAPDQCSRERRRVDVHEHVLLETGLVSPGLAHPLSELFIHLLGRAAQRHLAQRR